MSATCQRCGYDPGFDAAICPKCGAGSTALGQGTTVLATMPGVPAPRPSTREEPADAYFFVVSGPDRGQQFPVADSAVLGRQGDGISLSDAHVSRDHARIRRVGERYIYQDLLGTNGSYLLVRGQRVRLRGPHILQDDDEIAIGQTVVRFMRVRNEVAR